MEKNTIQERFRSAAKHFEEVYKKNIGLGFQARVSETAKVRASYFNEILKGKKDGPEEVRRKLVEGIALVCDEAKNFTYETFLDLGEYILTKGTSDGWHPPYRSKNYQSITTPEKFDDHTLMVSEPVGTYEYSVRDKNDRNMHLIAEWVNQQDEPGDYWTLLKIILAREEPEFKEWLKKQSSGDNQYRLPENKSAVGE